MSGKERCKVSLFCAVTINRKEFKDKLSLKEYRISGLCQQCQNPFFLFKKP